MEWVEYMTSDADLADGQPPPAERPRASRGALPYFGVGNESWGCGGNMRPEYYADQYPLRYNTFVKNYRPATALTASPAAPTPTTTTGREVLMERVGRRMNGLSLHYYTLPTGDWGREGLGHRLRRGPVVRDRCSRTLEHGRARHDSTRRSWTSPIPRNGSA